MDLVLHAAVGPRSRARALSAVWLPRLRWLAIVWIVVFWRLGYPALLDPDYVHVEEWDLPQRRRAVCLYRFDGHAVWGASHL